MSVLIHKISLRFHDYIYILCIFFKQQFSVTLSLFDVNITAIVCHTRGNRQNVKNGAIYFKYSTMERI